MMQTAVQLAMAFAGAFGFAMLFNLSGSKLWVSALGGAFCWGVYLLAGARGISDFVACLFAALAAGLGAQIMARVMKAPTTVFYVPMVVPLVPGRTLYYTMFSVLQKDPEAVRSYAYQTTYFCLAIAMGLGLAITFAHICRSAGRKIRKRA